MRIALYRVCGKALGGWLESLLHFFGATGGDTFSDARGGGVGGRDVLVPSQQEEEQHPHSLDN